MRALARELGVAPNALYSHVSDKNDLWDLVIDDVLGHVPVPDETQIAADPVGAIREVMADSFEVLVTHPDLRPQILARQGARGVQAQKLGVVTLNALAAAGVAGDEARDALRVLIVNTVGFAAFAVEDGVIPVDEIRGNHARSLDWLLTGILGR
jgi:AcrR family transcriptional regulator